MTDSEREALTLSLETGLPYLGLRDMAPSPNLLLYLPAALARSETVVPLSLQDNVLHLACTEPETDVSAIRARFPRLALEVSVSPADEVRTVLATMREAAA